MRMLRALADHGKTTTDRKTWQSATYRRCGAGLLAVGTATLALTAVAEPALAAGASSARSQTSAVTALAVHNAGSARSDHHRGANRQAPTIRVPGPLRVAANGRNGARVKYRVRVFDNDDRRPQVRCLPRSGGQFRPGRTVVRCTARDRSGNTATAAFPVIVGYRWSGLSNPKNEHGRHVFLAGQTVPVRFAFNGPSRRIRDAQPSFRVLRDGRCVDNQRHGDGHGTGNQFRYTNGQYVYNWSTRDLPRGDYQLEVNLGDGAQQTVNISLQ